MSIERITTGNGLEQPVTRLLEVVSEDANWLVGYEVDAEGARFSASLADSTLHVISTAAIEHRSVISTHGSLEQAS